MARLEVSRLACPHCGAAIPARPDGDEPVRCAYCQTELHISELRAGGPAAAPVTSSSTPLGRVLMATFGFGALLICGALTWIGVTVTRCASSTVESARLPVLEGASARPKRLFYLGYSTPQIASVAGGETAIALFRALDEGDELLFIAIDPSTQKERWRLTGLGSYGDGHQHTYAALAGQRLAVTDHTSRLRIFDVQTGKELSTLSLTDKPRRLTAFSARDGHRLWETALAGVDAFANPHGIVLSASRAYLGRKDSLEWYGLKDGKLEGSFGGRH